MENSKAFVLAELIIVSIIAVFIFSGLWSIYSMAWQWWRDTAPLIEAQKIARIALSSIIDGKIDSSLGTDGTYGRRNGIAWTVYAPVISSNLSAADKISFGLEKEKESFGDYPTVHNVRAYYLTTDEATGLKIVCYRDASSVEHFVRATLDISDLVFEYVSGYSNIIKVTAKASVHGSDRVIEYNDFVCLRNA